MVINKKIAIYIFLVIAIIGSLIGAAIYRTRENQPAPPPDSTTERVDDSDSFPNSVDDESLSEPESNDDNGQEDTPTQPENNSQEGNQKLDYGSPQ